MTIPLHLAEMFPQGTPFWEYSNPTPGMLAAATLFLILLGLGIAADVGMVLYWIKRPVSFRELKARLAARALPGWFLLAAAGVLVTFYLLVLMLYSKLFPAVELKPHTVIFQTLFFHVPVLLVIGLLLILSGTECRNRFGFHWKTAPKRVGQAFFAYLAVLPPLWILSLIYQFFLQKMGYDFYLQDVTEVLMAPATWPVRTVLFFIAIIIAPVFEEFIFRGILLPFCVRFIGFWPGIILVSLIFGGMHMHLPSFLPLFLLSVAFCLAYARTKSLIVPMGMHAAFNAVTVILLLLMG